MRIQSKEVDSLMVYLEALPRATPGRHVDDSGEPTAKKPRRFMQSPVGRLLRILFNGIPIVITLLIIQHLVKDTADEHLSADHHVRFAFEPPPFWPPAWPEGIGHAQSPGICFELPEGWKIKYNAKRAWCGGTVVGPGNNPRIRVSQFAFDSSRRPTSRTARSQYWQFVDQLTLPVGDVEVWKQDSTEVGYPFAWSSSAKVAVVDYHFFFGQHRLDFTIRKLDETMLTPIIWEIMQTAEDYVPDP
jgi:hypothetical protein